MRINEDTRPLYVSLGYYEASDTFSVFTVHWLDPEKWDDLPHGLFVINKLQPHTILGREIIKQAQAIGIPVAKSSLHLRQVYTDAPGLRSFVWRMGKKAEGAIEEIQALFSEVSKSNHRTFVHSCTHRL